MPSSMFEFKLASVVLICMFTIVFLEGNVIMPKHHLKGKALSSSDNEINNTNKMRRNIIRIIPKV